MSEPLKTRPHDEPASPGPDGSSGRPPEAAGGRPDEHDALEALYRDMMAGGAPDEVPTGPRFIEYRILEEIGAGSFGVVHRAWDERLRREVALKVLRSRDPASTERLLDEARALARVRHPHVLTVHGIAESRGIQAIVTEYVRGRSLAAHVRERGPIDAARLVRLGTDLADALAAVHAAGLVHDDVTASNVLLADDGRVVLGDFGLGHATAAGDDPGDRSLEAGTSAEPRHGGATLPGKSPAGPRRIAGSPAFIAPEKILGLSSNPRSDLYSLGVVLFHAATGAYPFDGVDVPSLFRSVLSDDPPDLAMLRPDIHRGLVAVVEKCLRKDPALRPRDAAELRDDLRRIAAVEGASGLRRDARRAPVAWVVGAAVLVGLVVVISVALRRQLGPWIAPPPTGTPMLAPEEAPLGIRGRWLLSRQDEVVELTGTTVPPSTALSVELSAERTFWLYILVEDPRGRKHLVFPREPGSGAGAFLPGATRRLPEGSKGWRFGADLRPATLIAIASPSPIGPLEDALPPDGADKDTGKDGYPRLKPSTVRGLIRVLGEMRPSLFSPAQLEVSKDDDATALLGPLVPPEGGQDARTVQAVTGDPGPWIRRLDLAE